MRRVHQAIVVEGKHDVVRVRSAVDAVVVATDGFRLFKDTEKMALLRRLAATRGLIILTDSDSAGGVIRNHLLGSIPVEQLRQAYIPPIPGKERRKAAPSKEGLLGVEGMDAATVLAALERAGAVFEDEEAPLRTSLGFTKADWMALGLCGTADSAARRERLAQALGVPAYLSANRLLELVNTTVTAEEWQTLLSIIDVNT
jgi:ribonuclease M5